MRPASIALTCGDPIVPLFCHLFPSTKLRQPEMRALRFHGKNDIRIDDIPEPSLRPNCVRIKNAWAGICGSDIHELLVGPKNTPTVPHCITGEQIPTVLGHEFSGTIVELGDGVQTYNGLQVGMNVAVFPPLGDRNCYYCTHDIPGACPNWGFLGYSGFGGGLAESICVDARDVYPLPPSVSLDIGALVEPLAVGWHAVKLGETRSDSSVLVLGAGPIGIAVILALRAHGAMNISVSEPSHLRSQHAMAFGAARVFNPVQDNVVELAQNASPDGLGPAVVIECAGVQQSIDVALLAVRGGGIIVGVGIFEHPIIISPNVINRRSLRYLGSNIYSRAEFQEVIRAIADGRIVKPERMITAKLALKDAIEHGFNVLVRNKDTHVKILVDPS